MGTHMYREEAEVWTFTAPLLARHPPLLLPGCDWLSAPVLSCPSILAAGRVFMGGVVAVKFDAGDFCCPKITE
jgi:hypothetical protein